MNFKLAPVDTLESAKQLLELMPDGWLHAARRILVITFKSVVENHTDFLRGMFPHADELHIRWYGHVAGSNSYQIGGKWECDTFVTIGDYYANRRWMFEHIAKKRRIYDPYEVSRFVAWAGEEQVRGELGQAHGRARDPWRTKPCSHVHIGAVLPKWWEGLATVRQVERSSDEQQAALRRILATFDANPTIPGNRRLWVVERLLAASMNGVGPRRKLTPQTILDWQRGKTAIPLEYEKPLRGLLQGWAWDFDGQP